MSKTIASLALFACSMCASVTSADILLFDIDTNPGGWSSAIAGLAATTGYDLSLDADYGVEAFDGPIGNAGGGPVAPGTIRPGISFDSELDGPGGGSRGVGGIGLVGVGPSGGFGNIENVILANFAVDAFKVTFDSAQTAFEFNAVSLLGTNTVDILVTDDSGVQTVFAGIFAPEFGHNIGVVGINGTNISSISIFDIGGFEGVQGSGQAYGAVPEPGSAALLGLLALSHATRRRR